MKQLCLLTACLLLVGCVTSEDDIAMFAEMEGWTSYQSTGYRPLACSKDDWFRTGFKAVKNGKQISGVICRGLAFKGATLRFD